MSATQLINGNTTSPNNKAEEELKTIDTSAAAVKSIKRDEREEMTNYWKNNSKRLNIQEMMLDENADQISEEESNEILSMLPDLKGKRIVELGAGIGRFTGRLADVASHVIAVDFMESFIDKNKETHSKYDNITFQCADVTKLDFQPKSVDIVFSNWLFMYISDEQTLQVFKKVLDWLTDDGYFFIRESCFHKSGNMQCSFNPTLYREPTDYTRIIEESTKLINDDKTKVYFDTVFARPVQTYIRYKQNANQICWLLKMKLTNDIEVASHHHEGVHNERFHTQEAEMIDRLMLDEEIKNNGMDHEEKAFYDELKLTGDQFVIDGGCGNGKYAFLLAREYNVQVLGVDVSSNQITLAMKRNNRIKDRRVFFEICNLQNLPYSSEMADVIHCKDALHHVANRKEVIAGLYKILKTNGGRIMIGEFTLKDKNDTEKNKKNHTDHFDTIEEYVKDLTSAGFKNVRYLDGTEYATKDIKKVSEKLASSREELLKTFSEHAVDENTKMMEWFSKLFVDRDTTGLAYTFFYGEK